MFRAGHKTEYKSPSQASIEEFCKDISMCVEEVKVSSQGIVSGSTFNSGDFFPFSNDLKFYETLNTISNYQSKKKDFLSVALFTGEGHLLSGLTEVGKHVHVIVVNDINQDVHNHLLHLIKSFQSSHSPKEFVEVYVKDNPLREKIWGESKSAMASD